MAALCFLIIAFGVLGLWCLRGQRIKDNQHRTQQEHAYLAELDKIIRNQRMNDGYD